MTNNKTKKKKKENKINNFDLFDNPMTRSAMKNMTPDQLKQYKIIGEQIYGNIDFETSSVNNLPIAMIEATAQIEEAIKAGLHPSDLDKDEVNLLIECFGENWYEKYGYKKEDLNEIVTLNI